jgi:deoxyribodipyrimidine photolyase
MLMCFVLLFFRFLLQCLEDLDHNLRKLNSRLFVIRGQPADAIPKLFKVILTCTLSQSQLTNSFKQSPS